MKSRSADKLQLGIWLPLAAKGALVAIEQKRKMGTVGNLAMEYLADGIERDMEHLKGSGYNGKAVVKALREASKFVSPFTPKYRRTKQSGT